jgi:hypothetical protein
MTYDGSANIGPHSIIYVCLPKWKYPQHLPVIYLKLLFNSNNFLIAIAEPFIGSYGN